MGEVRKAHIILLILTLSKQDTKSETGLSVSGYGSMAFLCVDGYELYFSYKKVPD